MFTYQIGDHLQCLILYLQYVMYMYVYVSWKNYHYFVLFCFFEIHLSVGCRWRLCISLSVPLNSQIQIIVWPQCICCVHNVQVTIFRIGDWETWGDLTGMLISWWHREKWFSLFLSAPGWECWTFLFVLLSDSTNQITKQPKWANGRAACRYLCFVLRLR